MKVARYWAREQRSFPYYDDGSTGEAGCWGWSERSQAEAQAHSRTLTERLIAWLTSDRRRGAWRGEYDYDNRPPREEIVQEIPDDSGAVLAVVTRNRYGALVLNTRDLAFVDIDDPRPARPVGRLIAIVRRLFGARAADATTPTADVLAPAKAWSEANPRVGFRVYRTAAGYRLLLNTAPLDAQSNAAVAMLEAMGSDPLYRRLCAQQECFRARLTPKPWRAELPRPPSRYPWATAAMEAAYRHWEKDYDSGCSRFATCEPVDQWGPADIDSGLAKLIRLHDEMTVREGAPLA